MANDLVLRDVRLPEAAKDRGVSAEKWNTITNVIWPKASVEVTMVAWDYCKARSLDPLKRPVHIVKTWDGDQRKYVEQIWEGIGSLRITAQRTGQHAGRDAPEFGPTITTEFGPSKLKVEHPEWCKVTVYKMIGGVRCPFVGQVWWTECVATKKGDEPNYMWMKRRRGQIAKCAEAEALRAAFPEEAGSLPTYEEMATAEDYDGITVETVAAEIVPPSGSKLDRLESRVAGGPSPRPAEGERVRSGGQPHPPVDAPPPQDHVGKEFDLPPSDGLTFPDGEIRQPERGVLQEWIDAWAAECADITADPETVWKAFKPSIAKALDLYKKSPRATQSINEFVARATRNLGIKEDGEGSDDADDGNGGSAVPSGDPAPGTDAAS